MNIEDSIVGVMAVAAGALAVGARYPLASYIIEQWNRAWGFRFGPRSVSTTAALVALMGVLVAGCGLAVLLSRPIV